MNTQVDDNMPLVSCIVTSFNKVNYLYEAIDSVLMQDYPAIELIIADDGTIGFPIDEISDYIQSHKNTNIKNYVIIHQKENVGTVRNINSAIKRATGGYLVNLDGDDVFYDHSVIRKMIGFMRENLLDFLECSKLRCDINLNELELLPTPPQRKRLQKLNTAKKQYHSFAVFKFYNIGGGSGVAYTKDCVRRLSLFDESFRNWQDGPTLISYVMQGRTIPTNFDIISIRYRDGGVSRAPSKNKEAFSHISNDRSTFTERYTVPDVWNPHFFLRRRRAFWHFWDKKTTSLQRSLLLLRYPEQALRVIVRKLCRHPVW